MSDSEQLREPLGKHQAGSLLSSMLLLDPVCSWLITVCRLCSAT